MDTRVRPQRASSRNPNRACPLCGGDGCSIYPPGGQCGRCFGSGKWKSLRSRRQLDCLACGGTGERPGTIACFRTEGKHRNRLGAWLHSLDEQTRLSLPPAEQPIPLASIEARHAFYSVLTDSLPLYGRHADHLEQTRQLSQETIARVGFASVPSRMTGDSFVRSIGGDLVGIPGIFHAHEKTCRNLTGRDGFYIPICDHQGRIQALQIRRSGSDVDAKRRYRMLGGAPGGLRAPNAGCPNHFINFDSGAKSVLVIEGILKAEIVAEHMHLVGLRMPVVGCVGTGTYGEGFARRLKELMPGLGFVLSAFDWDERGSKAASDTSLRRARLHELFGSVGVRCEAMEWDGAKGCDDWLLKMVTVD